MTTARLALLQGGAAPGGLATTDPILAAHLAHLRRRNLAAGTIAQRRYVLERFARHAGRRPIDATTADIVAFSDRTAARTGEPLAPDSIGAELAHLAGFYRWALLDYRRDDDPMLRVERPKVARRLPHPIPELELARAVDTAPERLRPMLMLAAHAGLRACEIAALKGEDLWWHLEPALIFIRAGKGGDQATVPLAPVLEPHLRGLPARTWLFPYRDGRLGHIPAHLVSQYCNDHLRAAGVTGYTLHSLRHRFGTQVHRECGDLRQTQELMRHRSPVSTAIYTAVAQQELAAIVAALPA